jgi:hypothetical protein
MLDPVKSLPDVSARPAKRRILDKHSKTVLHLLVVLLCLCGSPFVLSKIHDFPNIRSGFSG